MLYTGSKAGNTYHRRSAILYRIDNYDDSPEVTYICTSIRSLPPREQPVFRRYGLLPAGGIGYMI
jgi:hypothetical protein